MCDGKLEKLDTINDPEGIRHDRYCSKCDETYASTKSRFVFLRDGKTKRRDNNVWNYKTKRTD